MSNQITAYFKGRTGVAEPVYQNDYGMVLNFDGIYLPSNFDCHFSVLGSDTAIPGVGADNRVAIPNTVLSHEGNVTVHIPLHTGSDDSEVEYVVYFKVIGRARPEDDGTPVQMTAIEKALALLSQPITNIEEIVNEALSFTGETFDEMQEDLTEWKGGVEEGLDTWKDGVEEGLDTWKDGVEDGIDTFETQVMTMVGTPLVAGTVSGMTDHSKIYVYTGSETGYTAGNWYYWNGSEWTSGGTYNSTAFTTDTTLTASGAAADSKTVGDKVSALKEDLSLVTDERTITVEGVSNAYFEVGAKVVVEASYTRMVYAPIDGEVAEEATVSKTVGKLFRVGFTAVEPDIGVSIIDEAGTYIDAGQVTATTVNVPSTAKYIVATIWNANTDASTTSADDMIASVAISVNYGAKDNTARKLIADTNDRLSNIPAKDIDTFTRTGWNYIDDALVKEIGKYWNGGTIGSPISLANNASYNAVKIKADDSLYLVNPYVRYVHALDADQKLLQVITTDGATSFDNRTLNAAYLCFTFHAEGYSEATIYKSGTLPFVQYTASGQWVFPDLVADSVREETIYLPSKVYCAVGRTIELYNEQVALNADKYHVNWVCDVGVAYKRKFSVTGANANIGTHTLTLNLYDDNYNLVASKTASLIISANSMQSTIKVLPIGDSLTNGKEWLSEVPTLANSKIEYIGTRRLENRISEGRSGATSGWYVANSSYTYADGSVYLGNPNVSSSSNPFWDGSKFSLNHYITQQASYVGTPDAVQFMLGTNDLKQTATVVANIKTMVDTIHTEYPTMPIFICNAIFHSNQNGYYSTGGEGYIGVMTNWQYELDRYTIALMSALAEVFDNGTYNSFVTLVPVATCMDRENDFGQVSVPVNPRLASVTEIIPSQYTHPQSSGYLQMADAMYSAYCAKLS